MVSRSTQFEQRINQIIATATGLPTLPGVAAQIIAVVNDEQATNEALVKALQRDPALAAKILRVANSPIYGSRRGVECLSQAIVMLGLRATHSLALSFSLVSSLKLQNSGALDYALYWRRCLLAASAAKFIAAEVMPVDSDAAFLAALLQDLGMLVLDRAEGGIYRNMPCAQADHAALEAHEFRRCGISHAIVGEWMTREWGFSSRMQNAVAHSHAPELIDDEAERAFAYCVALGAQLADFMMSVEADVSLSDITQRASRSLGIAEEEMGRVVQSLAGAIPAYEKMFDMRLLDQDKLVMLSDLALEKLAELRKRAANE